MILETGIMIENAITYVKQIFAADSSGHDYHHTIRVYRLAVEIAKQENADMQIVQLAALLHDVDDAKLSSETYEDEKEVCERYDLFPNKEEWVGKILFIETCEEKPTPELFEREVLLLKEKGVFDVVKGVLVGKPQDEAYYQEYKDILIRVIDNEKLPIVYNVNFGHAMPRCALQYGAVAKVDMKQKKIYVNR